MKINLKKEGNKMKEKIKNGIQKSIIIGSTWIIPYLTYAASSEWAPVYQSMAPWINRCGIILFVVGGIDFAQSMTNDEPNSKLKGGAKMISGGVLLTAWGILKTVFPF